MSNGREESVPGGKFHTVQPLRDQESNWAVDLAKNLEDYLLKICSGEATGDVDGHLSVNFAEAALLLQGSIQVYSRKVEYLYSLVLHALEFISQKSQHDQPESTSAEPETNGKKSVPAEEDDPFWGFDDIAVDAKSSLDSTTCRDVSSSQFVKPPANLVVLEGDCLDAIGDGGELESYLLATNDLYRDFILLDSCDAVAVDDFLPNDDIAFKPHSGPRRGSTMAPKTNKSFLSPTRQSGGKSHHKLSAAKNLDENFNKTPFANNNAFENNSHGFGMDDGFSGPNDFDDDDDEDDDDEDPWKQLNPHEPGNLKVKPFKKVKAVRRDTVNQCKRVSTVTDFPPAKLNGTISLELTRIWETQNRASSKKSDVPPLYEKLRESLVHGMQENLDAFHKSMDDNDDDGYDSGNYDSEPPKEMPEDRFANEGPSQPEKDDYGGDTYFDTNQANDFQGNLEDLCRSHLDSLLASIAESEKQTEMAARVSTWKQRIEQNLEEQDSHPPFDIHDYGERVLNKLSVGPETKMAMSFADVVQSQEKHDIARTFSALLQLVNNGNVDLEKNGDKVQNGEPPCFTATNPFYVRLIRNAKRREDVQLRSSKKRRKTPKGKSQVKGKENDDLPKSPLPSTSGSTRSNLPKSPSTSISTRSNGRSSVKVRKAGVVQFSRRGKPKGKTDFDEQME